MLTAAFSPDGERVVTGSTDQTAIWDAETGAPLLTLRGHRSPSLERRVQPRRQ